MNRKASLDWNAGMIAGFVFLVIGTIYLVIGIALCTQNPADPDATMVGKVFLPLGALLLVISGILLLWQCKKHRKKNRLMEEGRYIWGQIVQLDVNRSVRVNRRHPTIAIVEYRDSSGVLHFFKSQNIYRYVDTSLIGKQVKVYTLAPKYSPYHVDMVPLLSAYQEH